MLDKEKWAMVFRIVGIGLLCVAVALLLVPATRQKLLKPFVPAKTVETKKESQKESSKKKEPGYNKVDYSVIHNTVTTVSSSQPGQAYIDDFQKFLTYQGFMTKITLPQKMKAEDLQFQDDYMKKKLVIHFPLEYYDEFSQMKLEGMGNNIVKTAFKKKVSDARLNIIFDRTFSFHYCVDKGVLYIMYGSPSLYYDKIMVIDAGHGGVDYGSYTSDMSYIEKNINVAVIQNMLQDYEKQTDVMVYFTRADDTGLSLNERIGLANEIGADLFLSVHCNFLPWYYGSAYGTETLYSSNDKKKKYNSKWLAKQMQKSFATSMNLYDRGIMERGDLRVLRKAKMPAVLLEMGFISNGSDVAKLNSVKGQKKAAQTIEQVLNTAMEKMVPSQKKLRQKSEK